MNPTPPTTEDLLRDAMHQFNEAKARRDAIQTTVVYHRTAIVRRDVGGGWDPYVGGHCGTVRDFEVTEVTKSPEEQLPGELSVVGVIRVTTITEVL